MKALFLFLIVFYFKIGLSQNVDRITFVPVYNGQKIELNSKISSEQGDWVEINTLRFYISHLQISGKTNWKDNTMAHLIDLEDSSTLTLNIEGLDLDTLSFYLGIDSLTNVSGILDGDLDPILGMYWSWNSGYINFKLEGNSSELSENKGKFEYHIGGYLPPYPTLQKVEFTLNKQGNQGIEIELSKLINHEKLKNKSEIMIPGKDAADLSKILPSLFQNVGYEE